MCRSRTSRPACPVIHAATYWRARHATPFVVIFRVRPSSSSISSRRSAAGTVASGVGSASQACNGVLPASAGITFSVFHHRTHASSSVVKASNRSGGASGSTGCPLACNWACA
jgi:hypothetical protein